MISRGHVLWLVVGTLGVSVFALVAWVIVLQNKNANLQDRELQLREHLEDAERNKGRDDAIELGFLDLPFKEALARARVEVKPVMALFFTQNSGPSMGMERSTWNDRTVQDWLRAKIVAVKINADKEPEFAVANNITGLPVMVFYMADGKEIGRIVGYHSAQDFISEATSVVNRIKK